MKNDSCRYIAKVQRDENDEPIIVFPPEFCEQTDLREGDIYEMDVVNGSLVMIFIRRPSAIRQYPIAIQPGDDQTAFGVFFPDIPGCFSAGDSLSEAIHNAPEALALHIDGLDELPEPSRIDDHVNKPEFEGCVWMMVSVPERNNHE